MTAKAPAYSGSIVSVQTDSGDEMTSGIKSLYGCCGQTVENNNRSLNLCIYCYIITP